MAAPAPIAEPDFDPLVEFAGMWNTRLAERYLPIPELPGAKYECVDGRLIMTPGEGFSNTYGEGELLALLRPAARAAGLYVATTANLTFLPDRWLQPDLAILQTPPRTPHEDTWVPAELCTMVVAFTSPSNRVSRRVDKPHVYATGGVPYFMQVEIARQVRHVSVELRKLVDGRYERIAAALAGQLFESKEPFPIRFAPEELLY